MVGRKRKQGRKPTLFSEPTNLHPKDLVASFKNVSTISQACRAIWDLDFVTVSGKLRGVHSACHRLEHGRHQGACSLMCRLLVLAYKLTFIFLFLARWCIFTTHLSRIFTSLRFGPSLFLTPLSSRLPVSCSRYKECLLANKIWQA